MTCLQKNEMRLIQKPTRLNREGVMKLIEWDEMPSDIREASAKAVNRMLDELPSAKPTRKEWEEWVDRMPDLSSDVRFLTIAIKKWHLEMPGIPKEDE